MSLITLLESADIKTIQQALKERFLSNLQFFTSFSDPLAKALQEPAREYNLWLDEKGINVVNLQEKSLLFPEVEGRHGMLASAKYLASSPLTHPNWKLYTNDLRPHFMDEEKFPLSGLMHNELLKSASLEGMLAEGMHLPNDFLPSVTLLGLAGGLHLECLRERYAKIHSLLIFEESMDLFRISCHLVDFSALFDQVSDRACYLFVESVSDRAFIKNFFEVRRVSSNFLRLELSLYETPKIATIREAIAEAHAVNARGWGTFEDEMIGVRNALENVSYLKEEQKHPVLLNPKRLNAPLCVVGNGPSLDALLPFIRQNANKMIILSSGTALKPLLSHGITPDFQVEIERIDFLHEVLEGAPLGEIPLLSGTMVNPKALSLAKESYLFQRGGSAVSELHKPEFILGFSSPFVGNAAFALACLFGSDVLIAGLDCGYIKGAKKHAQNSFYGEEEIEIPSGCFAVRGNGTKEVYSDSIFSLSRENLENAIKVFTPQMVLNLGEGAYIEGARPTHPSEFELRKIDKKSALEEFKRAFVKETSQLFREEKRDFHLLDWEELARVFEELWARPVSTKKELFAFIDEAFALLASHGRRHPFIGTLLSGSISHYLQALLLDAIHIPSNDISTFFERARSIFAEGMKRFKSEYAGAVLKARIKSGTAVALSIETLGQ